MSPSSVRPSYSAITLICLALIVYLSQLLIPRWDTHNVLAVLTWDVLGYYLYLPAQFIYHDLGHLAFADTILREYAPTSGFYQAFVAPDTGLMVMKYPVGLALLDLPFFGLAHWLAVPLGYKPDGFTAPYQIAIAYAGTTYGLIGLMLLRRVLLQHFADGVVAIALILIVLGTNYFQYGIYDAAMPHVYSFFLYALIIWLSARFYAQPRALTAGLIGLALGINVICRPSEMVAAIIPLLWGLTSVTDLRARIAFWRRYWTFGGVLVVMGLVGVLPQLIYWKLYSGHFFFYSYGDQTFSFLRPHVLKVLFSFRKGWLIYTPLMVLAIAGFVVLYRWHRTLFGALFAFFLVNLWVVSAWDIWWYGGSLSCRALVQSYAVMIFPLAGTVSWFAQRARRLYFAMPALLLLVLLNMFQHWQYAHFIIVADGMVNRYYWAIFGRTTILQPTLNRLYLRDRLPTDHAWAAQPLAQENFESLAVDGVVDDHFAAGRHGFMVKQNVQFPPGIQQSLGELKLRPGHWVRSSVKVYYEQGAWGAQLVFGIRHRDAGETYKYVSVPLHNLLTEQNRWNDVWFDAIIPDDAQPSDIVNVGIFSQTGIPYYIDELRLDKLSPAPAAAQ